MFKWLYRVWFKANERVYRTNRFYSDVAIKTVLWSTLESFLHKNDIFHIICIVLTIELLLFMIAGKALEAAGGLGEAIRCEEGLAEKKLESEIMMKAYCIATCIADSILYLLRVFIV